MDAPGLDAIILGSKSQRVLRRPSSDPDPSVPPYQGLSTLTRTICQLFRLQQSIAALLGPHQTIRCCGGPLQIYPDVVVDCVAYAHHVIFPEAAVELHRLSIQRIVATYLYPQFEEAFVKLTGNDTGLLQQGEDLVQVELPPGKRALSRTWSRNSTSTGSAEFSNSPAASASWIPEASAWSSGSMPFSLPSQLQSSCSLPALSKQAAIMAVHRASGLGDQRGGVTGSGGVATRRLQRRRGVVGTDGHISPLRDALFPSGDGPGVVERMLRAPRCARSPPPCPHVYRRPAPRACKRMLWGCQLGSGAAESRARRSLSSYPSPWILLRLKDSLVPTKPAIGPVCACNVGQPH